MPQVYTFTDSNGEVRLMAEIHPAPGGAQSIIVVRQTVLFSDFPAPVGGNSFVPIQVLATGIILLFAGFVCTETFNDSGFGALSFQMTDEGNNQTIGPLTSGGAANPGVNLGVLPIVGGPAQNATDGAAWETDPATAVFEAGLVTTPWTIGLSDNGTLLRDGTAGKFKAVVGYIPAT